MITVIVAKLLSLGIKWLWLLAVFFACIVLSCLRREKRLVTTIYRCPGFNARIISFRMEYGEEEIDRLVPHGYVHAGHQEMLIFLDNYGLEFFFPLFAFRGKGKHESVKISTEAFVRPYNAKDYFMSSEEVFMGRGFAYALLVQSK